MDLNYGMIDYVINKGKKDIQSYSLFQKKIKSRLIEIEYETDYF